MAKTGATIRVRLTPRSGRNEVTRWEAGVLHARVTAPPVAGAANTALVELVAEALSIPKSRVTIVSGASSREKRVEVDGLSDQDVQRALSRFAVE